jgi:hypothetical protein
MWRGRQTDRGLNKEGWTVPEASDDPVLVELGQSRSERVAGNRGSRPFLIQRVGLGVSPGNVCA